MAVQGFVRGEEGLEGTVHRHTSVFEAHLLSKMIVHQMRSEAGRVIMPVEATIPLAGDLEVRVLRGGVLIDVLG